MSKVSISPAAFQFLKDLKNHQQREWFVENKERYLTQLANIESFAHALLMQMNTHDVIETESGKKVLHRIYRDTRFSKDKRPYHLHWGGGFKRASKKRRGSYYFHLEPGNSHLAGGFWGPNPADLKRIRHELAQEPERLRNVLAHKNMRALFGKLQGEQVKTAPKGFHSDDPAIDLLRYKQFLLIHRLSDAEVLSAGFVKQASQVFKAMRPFLDYMSETLSTDLNGEEL